jgi:hypothetical protein
MSTVLISLRHLDAEREAVENAASAAMLRQGFAPGELVDFLI